MEWYKTNTFLRPRSVFRTILRSFTKYPSDLSKTKQQHLHEDISWYLRRIRKVLRCQNSPYFCIAFTFLKVLLTKYFDHFEDCEKNSEKQNMSTLCFTWRNHWDKLRKVFFVDISKLHLVFYTRKYFDHFWSDSKWKPKPVGGGENSAKYFSEKSCQSILGILQKLFAKMFVKFLWEKIDEFSAIFWKVQRKSSTNFSWKNGEKVLWFFAPFPVLRFHT